MSDRMSVISQTVTSPSWRMIFSCSRAGLWTYSLVWASSRRSQSKSNLRIVVETVDQVTEDRAHGATGQRIPDQDSVVPALVQQVGPVSRRLVGADRVRVVDDQRRCEVERVVATFSIATAFGQPRSPRWRARRQKSVTSRASEQHRRSAKPDICLWVCALRADAVEHLPASPCRASGRRLRDAEPRRPLR